MTDGILASIPLGWLAALGLGLLAVGLAIGSLLTHQRLARKAFPVTQRLVEVLNALPQPALLANFEAQVTAQNARATQILREFDRQSELPLTVDAAVVRVTRSRVAETLEIPLPNTPARRFKVLVSPLFDGGSQEEALVLFSDPDANVARPEVYQQLTNAIAHELRTPLTAILGHVEILNSCKLDDEALWRRSLGFVSSETERLARLVEDLLSLSRLDRAPLYLQPVNMRLVAEEAISALYALAEKQRVKLVLQAPAFLPRAQADADRLRQVFLNLLENAIKYAPESTVTVQLAHEGEILRVEVSDTGPGVLAEDMPHIFEPLYRSERTATGVRGTGLGLTIVQTILAQHDAPIQVQSELGKGTTFSFSLPIEGAG